MKRKKDKDETLFAHAHAHYRITRMAEIGLATKDVNNFINFKTAILSLSLVFFPLFFLVLSVSFLLPLFSSTGNIHSFNRYQN